MKKFLQNSSKAVAVAALLGISGHAMSQNGGYITGDFHQHSTYTDGSWTIGSVLAKSNEYGLSWWANSEHGGASSLDASKSGVDLGSVTYWDSYQPNPIRGTVSMSGGHQRMWRWQVLMEYSFGEVMKARNLYSDRVIFQGYEMNVPGHEHGSMCVFDGQWDAKNPNASVIAQYEYMFDNSDRDMIGGAEMGWTKSVLTGHAKSVEAVTWLQTNYPKSSWLVPAHPERQRTYPIHQLRDLNNAGPDVFFGFESMPGHQKSAGRGGYGSGANGGGTYGGCGVFAAKVGGLWDAMLSEGRHFWLFASSDFHDIDDDFWPGEYQKTYTYVRDRRSPQSIADGLRSGNTWVVEGDLIDALDFRINSTSMGGTTIAKDNMATLRIRIHDPEGANHNTYSDFTNPSLDHIDVIMGKVSGIVEPGSPMYMVDTVATTSVIARFDANGGVTDANGITSIAWKDLGQGWKEMKMTVKNIEGKVYFRLRGSNYGLNVANETDAAGNPLADALLAPNTAAKAFADLWFYTNPIFLESPVSDSLKSGKMIASANFVTAPVEVFPTVANSEVTVRIAGNDQPVNIRLISLDGRQVAAARFQSEEYLLNLSGLRKGVYSLVVETGNEVKTSRIIKE